MNKRGNGGKGVLVVVVILIVILVFFWKTGKLGDWLGDFSVGSVRSGGTYDSAGEGLWCKEQVFSTVSDVRSPRVSKVLGWDNVKNCCVQEYTGWDCALNREVSLEYCYTGQIGGVIVWITVDDYYVSVNDFDLFFGNMRKESTPEVCDKSVYPEELR